MVFVKSHIPSRRHNNFKIPSNIQILPFEINPRKEKWVIASICKLSILEKQIFSLVFHKSITILLNSV